MKNLLNIQVAFTEVFGVFLLGLACCVVNVFLQYQSASGVLHIEIETDKKGMFQLFWDSDEEDYSEQNSFLAEITASPMAFSIDLPTLVQIDHLRIDPNNIESVVVFKKFQLIFSNGESVDLLPQLIGSKITRQQQLDFVVDKKSNTLVVTALGVDPNFEFLLPLFKCLHLEWKQNCLFLLIFTLVMAYILNQNILKGSKQNGILFISFPEKQYAHLHKIIGGIKSKSPRMWQEMRGKKVVYKMELEEVDPHFVVDLVYQITQKFPESFVCFQYNRSCEI
jgi:hypothetical protein